MACNALKLIELYLTFFQRHRKHLISLRTQISGGEESLPPVTDEAIHLIRCLLTDREMRLSCRAYRDNDIPHRGRPGRGLRYQTSVAHFVCANDAEDIKAHRFFNGVNWETMHLSRPPWTPSIKEGQDIAMHFVDKGQTLSSSQVSPHEAASLIDHNQPASPVPASPAETRIHTGGQRVAVAKQNVSKISAPPPHRDHHPSTQTLSNGNPSSPSSSAKQVGRLKKCPNDKILRNPSVARTALEVRKRAAFLGYTYRRCELPDLSEQYGKEEEKTLRRRIVRGNIPWGSADVVGEQEDTGQLATLARMTIKG